MTQLALFCLGGRMDAPPNPNDRPIKPHKCEGCWKPASSGIKLFQCARCHKFGYCSRACQAWDWITAPTHVRDAQAAFFNA